LGFPVSVLQRDHFLGPVRPRTDEHQRGQALVLQADSEIHSVGPDIHIIAVGQRARTPALVVLLPDGDQARDGARRQSGLLTQNLPQRRSEVRGGQTPQIQNGKQLGQTLGAAQVRRQNLTLESLALAQDAVILAELLIDRAEYLPVQPGKDKSGKVKWDAVYVFANQVRDTIDSLSENAKEVKLAVAKHATRMWKG
jgi:hypothetical protein